MSLTEDLTTRTWWHRGKPYSKAELWADGIVHSIGLVMAIGAGGALLIAAGAGRTASEFLSVGVYVGSLICLFAVSLAFNLSPVTGLKRFLARLDQAAIFLLIAGTYTPLLAVMAGTPTGDLMLPAIWGATLIGIGLKLFVPQHLGKLSLLLYAGIGWSGIVVFQSLAESLPPSTMWFLLAGGVAYTSGIIFHVWDRLHFHNVLWHTFVVIGATIHLWAIADCLLLSQS